MDAATETHTSADAGTATRKRGRPKGVTNSKKDAPAKAANPSARITAAAKKQALIATTENASNGIASGKVERRGRPKGSKNKTPTRAHAAPKKAKVETAPKKTKARAALGETNPGEKRKRGRPAKGDQATDSAEKPVKRAKKEKAVAEAKEEQEAEAENGDENAQAEECVDDQEASELQLKGRNFVPAKDVEENEAGLAPQEPASNVEEVSEL
jgi:hypothetical protein